jgi:hypothetical protein
MDVDPDVALGIQGGCAGVQTHSHRDRPRRERSLPSSGGGDGPSGGREGDEERIPLGVDLHTPLGGERVPQEAAVLGERLRVDVGPELPQEARRALDVSEQERHRPGGQVPRHALSRHIVVFLATDDGATWTRTCPLVPGLSLRSGARRRRSPASPSGSRRRPGTRVELAGLEPTTSRCDAGGRSFDVKTDDQPLNSESSTFNRLFGTERGTLQKRMKGLEPSTFCMASRRSSQLSYIRRCAAV